MFDFQTNIFINHYTYLFYMKNQPSLEDLKQAFLKEIQGITDIDQLKDLYAQEIARRDKIILDLQNSNQIIMKSAFKTRSDELKHSNR